MVWGGVWVGGLAVWDSCFEFVFVGGEGGGGLGAFRVQNFGCSGFMISGLRVCPVQEYVRDCFLGELTRVKSVGSGR